MRRVSAAGKFDFFWGVVEKNKPALVMRLSENSETGSELPALKNLDVRMRQLDGKMLVLSLMDEGQRGLFYTLCLDIVEAGEGADDEASALERVIRRMRRWHLLLKGGSTNSLSVEAQRGLVGELAFLRELTGRIGPDAAIESWKGPEGASKDFEFPDLCVEIKSRRGAAKPYVSISSEDQLADVADARLFLRVYDVDSAIIPDGLRLEEHVAETRQAFTENIEALDRLEILLDAAGFDPAFDYGARRWVVGRSRTFEVKDGFPRLASPLPAGVARVRYDLALDACSPFEASGDILGLLEE